MREHLSSSSGFDPELARTGFRMILKTSRIPLWSVRRPPREEAYGLLGAVEQTPMVDA